MPKMWRAGDVGRGGKGHSEGLIGAYWEILEGHRRAAARAILFTVVSGLLETAAILSVVPIIEPQEKVSAFGLDLHGSSLRYAAVIAFGVLAVAASLVRVAAERSITRVVARFESSRRRELTRAALEMDWSAYLKVRVGDVNSSLLLAVNQVSYGVQFFVRSMGMLGVAAVFIAVAASLSWQLSLFALAFVALAAVTYLLGVRPTRRHTSTLTSAASSLGQEADLLFSNLKLFRSQGERSQSQERMDAIYSEYARAYVKGMYIVPTTRSMFEVGGIIGIAVVLFGALATAHGAALSAASLAFLVLFLRLAPRLVSSQELLQNARSYRSWCDTWWSTLETMHASPMFAGGTTSPHFERELRVESLSFTYPDRSEPVLHDVTWTLRPGQAIALVGESGTGKTTMLDLVTGLLRPTGGRIVLDEADMSEIDIEQWQSHLGLVPQEAPLFAGTVLENVYWMQARRDPDDAYRCLKQAHAAEFVDRLPEGMDTVLGERGATLSGGQRQRLALARALYRHPWILVLDEPTSSLDAEAEQEVLAALADVKATSSMIIVAHGLGPVRLADHIYVMAQGTVVEEGTWTELVGRPDGQLARIVRQHSVELQGPYGP